MGETRRPFKDETGKYTIVTVEGTGDRAAFYRVADHLVRGSRIYRHLCKKIYKAKATAGRNRMYSGNWRARYIDERREHREFVRQANKQFMLQEKKIEKLQKRVDDDKLQKKKLTDQVRSMYSTTRGIVNTNKRLTKQMHDLKVSEATLTHKFKWGQNGFVEKAEFMLRSLIGYKELEVVNQIKFHEMMYLSMGMQMDAFGFEEVSSRFGNRLTDNYKNDIADLVIKGYIRRFTKRDKYFITDKGKTKFKDVMNRIHTKEHKAYWNEVFNKV